MNTTSVPAISLGLAVGGLAICPPGSGVAPRVIPDYELVWVAEGNATWICDGVSRPAPPGTVILVQPSMRHAFRWDLARPSRVGYLHFEFIEGLDALPPRRSWPTLAKVDVDDIVQPLFLQIVRLSEEQPEEWEVLAHSAAVHLLRSFVTGNHRAGSGGDFTFPPAVERALLHVSEEWGRHGRCVAVPLEALCAAAAVSPRHLSRLFQESFGAGPIQTLRLARLEIAADLLRHTDLTLDRIAHYTGFANAFHLSRAFRSAHGVPPGAFRASPVPVAPASSTRGQARRLVSKLLPWVRR